MIGLINKLWEFTLTKDNFYIFLTVIVDLVGTDDKMFSIAFHRYLFIIIILKSIEHFRPDHVFILMTIVRIVIIDILLIFLNLTLLHLRWRVFQDLFLLFLRLIDDLTMVLTIKTNLIYYVSDRIVLASGFSATRWRTRHVFECFYLYEGVGFGFGCLVHYIVLKQ